VMCASTSATFHPGPGQYPAVHRKKAGQTGRVVIAAAHNEADRVGDTLEALRAALPDARLLVADDASTDGTQEVAMRHGAWVVRRGRSHGKGGNVGATAEAALDGLDPAATVLLCDADLGSSAGQLTPLVEAVERGDCDLAVARFEQRQGGGLGIAVGYAGRAIARLSGFHAEAPVSGQRAMRASDLRRLLPFARSYGMELGMTVDAVRAGMRVREIELPLSHRATHRTLGGFLHRARQLRDFRRAARERRAPADSLPSR
jgi:glycosyltransferase involved in cell wall biosynthesis